jgi:hypothetical protein
MKNRRRDDILLQRVSESLNLSDFAGCERLRAALHESGHLIAAKILSESIIGIGLGGTNSDAAGTWTRMRSRDVFSLRNRLIVLWSGPLSDGRPVPPVGDGLLADDESQMFDIARELCGADAKLARIQNEISRAKSRAVKLVRRHRPEIEQLAHKLCELYSIIDGVKRA